MTDVRTRLAYAAGMVAIGWAARAAPAASVTYSITSAYASYAGYDVANIKDGNVYTDYASQGGGTDTYIDLDFGSAIDFGGFTYMDRTSSGGSNGTNTGGEFDDVTSFDLIFSQDAIFGNDDDVVKSYTNVNDPNGQTYPPGDVTTGNLIGTTARYVEFKVTGFEGSSPSNYGNVGGAELSFAAVPLPMAAVAGFGLLGFVGAHRARKALRTV